MEILSTRIGERIAKSSMNLESTNAEGPAVDSSSVNITCLFSTSSAI